MISGFDRAAFDRDGYCRFGGPDVARIKGAAESAMLDAALFIARRTLGEAAPQEADLSSQLAAMCDLEPDRVATRACYELFAALPDVIALINAPPFLEAVRAAGVTRPSAGTNPLVRLDRPGDTRFATPLHQDYWYSLLSERAVVIWTAIGPLDESMGPVEVLPGSQTAGLRRFKTYEAGHEWFECAEPVDGAQLRPAMLADDEAVIFDQRLLHRSGHNHSDRVRVSVQLRYNDLDAAQTLASTFTPALSRYVLEGQRGLLAQAEEAVHDA